MLLPRHTLILIGALAALTACSDAPAGDGHDHGPGGAAAHGHADAQAVPGSHADWCGEHEIAESKCTRCDAKLSVAFKATGDWCAEHGLPESHCVKCDPSRKAVRPPEDA
ncbi:MAG: hypothetical protein ACT4PU_09130 [Planctomycetota bacterium]